MSWLALVLGVLVATGAVVALSARDPRVGIVGLVAALALAPLAADPLPDPLAVAARILAAALAAYLVRVPVRDAPTGRPGRPAWPATATAAAALFVAGLAAHATVLDGAGAAGATAAAVTLAGLVVVPLVERSDGPRTAFAILLVVTAADLAQVGLAGPSTAFEALVVAAAIIALAAAASVVIARPRASDERPPMAGRDLPADQEPLEATVPDRSRARWRVPRPDLRRPRLDRVLPRRSREPGP